MPGGRPKEKKRHNLTLFNERRSRERRNVTANETAICVIEPMSCLDVGMVKFCAETVIEALVLSVRVFGVTAA